MSLEDIKNCFESAEDIDEDSAHASEASGRAQATGSGGSSQVSKLIDLGKQAELFLDQYEEPFATIPVGNHNEHRPIQSRQFFSWLFEMYTAANTNPPSPTAVRQAQESLMAFAMSGPKIPVYVRIAAHGDKIYLDLVQSDWQVVEVSVAGYKIVPYPPVKFRRTKGMLELPEPLGGGSVDQLRRFLNVGSDDDFRVIVGWLIMAFNPSGPYPVLVLQGEQGSAKTTNARIIRSLIDPNISPARSEPRTDQDLAITAQNSWTPAFDNLSGMSARLSDGLCRLSTGGGFSTRTLYENNEETIFDATRPIILTGIESLATKSDLLDRSLVVTLPHIPDSQRRTEREFTDTFAKDKPTILGALLNAVAEAIKNLPNTNVPNPPRLADFAVWVTAAEPALPWKPGDFLKSYALNRDEGNAIALESSPVTEVLVELIKTGPVHCTATKLLDKLNQRAPEHVKNGRAWPKTPQALSSMLNRLKPNLRAVGIEVKTGVRTGKERTRMIEICNISVPSSPTAQPGSSTTPPPGSSTTTAPPVSSAPSPSPAQPTPATGGTMPNVEEPCPTIADDLSVFEDVLADFDGPSVNGLTDDFVGMPFEDIDPCA